MKARTSTFTFLFMSCNRLLQSCADCFAFFFITGLVHQREHVLFLFFDTRLVERINAQHITTDSTGFLEEIEQLADVISIYFRHRDFDVWNTTVYVCQLSTQFCHLIYFVYTFPGKEVQAVQIGFVCRDFYFV